MKGRLVFHVVNPHDFTVVSCEIVPEILHHGGSVGFLPADSRRIRQAGDVTQIEQTFVRGHETRIAVTNLLEVSAQRANRSEAPGRFLEIDAQISSRVEQDEPARQLE